MKKYSIQLKAALITILVLGCVSAIKIPWPQAKVQKKEIRYITLHVQPGDNF